MKKHKWRYVSKGIPNSGLYNLFRCIDCECITSVTPTDECYKEMFARTDCDEIIRKKAIARLTGKDVDEAWL